MFEHLVPLVPHPSFRCIEKLLHVLAWRTFLFLATVTVRQHNGILDGAVAAGDAGVSVAGQTIAGAGTTAVQINFPVLADWRYRNYKVTCSSLSIVFLTPRTHM